MSWRPFHRNKRVENRVMTTWFRLVVVCLLLPLAWSVSLSAKAWGAAPAPMVVRVDPLKLAPLPEATLLAQRILARESKELLLDKKRRSELAHEIEGMLKRLRYAHPEIEKISARAAHLPGVLLLGMKPRLFRDVSRSLTHLKDPVKLRTGYRAFDALNAKLGLRAVRPYRHISVLVMHLSGRANIEAARRAYMKVAGVEYAEPDSFLGDGSDIEAMKSGDVWHIVVRKAWGDCPAGCIYKKLFYFTVKDGDVERIEPARAMESPHFRKILETRNWR
ncbi:MAG: hypothetical protein OXG62_14630 [Nitrospinae bacterium]|nr:hypothetical protein [Nitrospinota bacterium]